MSYQYLLKSTKDHALSQGYYVKKKKEEVFTTENEVIACIPSILTCFSLLSSCKIQYHL